VNRIASLCVRKLEVKHVAGLLAHTGAAKSNAGRSESSQLNSKRIGIGDLGHELSSLSG
jgi:hypothetical protein